MIVSLADWHMNLAKIIKYCCDSLYGICNIVGRVLQFDVL